MMTRVCRFAAVCVVAVLAVASWGLVEASIAFLERAAPDARVVTDIGHLATAASGSAGTQVTRVG